MTEINFRSFLSGDEKNIVDLWNRCLPQDPISLKRFRNLVLLDANFDPAGLHLAFDQQELIGCLYAVRRLLPMIGTELDSEQGWITFFFVAPEYARKGIGTQLIAEGCTFLRGVGRKEVYFSSYAPNYILPGIDEQAYPAGYQFLVSQGFEKLYSPVAMNRSLVYFQMPDDVQQLIAQREAEGFTFGTVQDGDLYALIQFANQVFNPDWGRAIREGLLQGLPPERILVAKKDDNIVGFCLYGGYEGIPERFGPFGVDPTYQGKGLGKILLYQCLRLMRREGLHGAWFLWTGEKTAAGHLYKKVDFQVTRQFHVLKKIL